jgi:predicted ATPase
MQASKNTQVWVVTHADHLIAALKTFSECHSIQLEKNLGQTQVAGQGLLDAPPWHWPDKI